ncbi:MAG TPA: 23S rRNA (pseudouridine(1915)-N(3))-methyltransferase RlmH [Fredinandcohnia sp.]|nr:23S rRNA (pseudouridine(1915)-N(3))-methyltransferase RlmH [Fredinandcohnia sp.]
MKIRILAIGSDRSGLFEPAVEEYLARIRRVVPIAVEEVAPARKGGQDPSRARDLEGRALLDRLRPGEMAVVLDERGTQLDSRGFAERVLGEAMNRGRDLAFLIGGAEGHSREVVERADLVLSLSRLTLAHRLARLVLAEQIYRGLSILRGEPYHK